MILLDLFGLGYIGNDKYSYKMLQNKSKIFESRYVSVDVCNSNSILFNGLQGSTMGVWVAHAEGRFSKEIMDNLPVEAVLKYSNSKYPFNPNGSYDDIAGICSIDGCHTAMMPHPERSILPWQCAYYPNKDIHQITPWVKMFENAIKWIIK